MPFTDPHLGVYTSTIVRSGSPVLLVFHDEDGDWQFLASTEQRADEITRAHVGHLVEDDPSLHELADLRTGWKAWRESADGPWQREPTPDGQGEI